MTYTIQGVKAEYAFSRVCGLLVVQFRGIFDYGSVAELRREMVAETERRPAVKALVDLRPAIFIVNEDQMRRITAASLADHPVDVAVGILVNQVHLRMCFDHCAAMSAKSRTRVPLTSLEDAEEWAGVPLPMLRPTREFVPAALAQTRQART
jgi:hypothetical protein